MRSDLQWDYFDDVIDDSIVENVENTLNISFPKDYKSIIKQYHGGRPDKRKFKVESDNMITSLAVLLSFDSENAENIIDMYNMIEDQLPNGIIPFGDNGGGDFICFDTEHVNDLNEPTVVYWHHEKNMEDSISKLNNSFSEFLDRLY